MSATSSLKLLSNSVRAVLPSGMSSMSLSSARLARTELGGGGGDWHEPSPAEHC